VLSDPDDLAARTQMLKAATFAGIAIEHSMLGAAHSIANPLTAHHGVVHGQAVGMALPHVVRFNAADAETASIYATLARATNVCPEDTPEQRAVEALALRLEDLLVTTGFGGAWSRLSSLVDIPMLAAEAANQWTAQFNPRRVSTPEFTELFCTAFEV
jgi:alcohol dehydrogenase